MNTVIGVLSTVFIMWLFSTGIPNVKNNEKISGDEIIKNMYDEIESNDIIQINNLYRIDTEEYAAKSREVDLTYEYPFLIEIERQNDLIIKRQLKVYIAENDTQKSDEYSKFQENVIYYNFEDNEESSIEIIFSENKILNKWKENSEITFKESIIDNESVHIFEWKIPLDGEKYICKAQFSINKTNFSLYLRNVSHEDFMKLLKTTIKEFNKSERNVLRLEKNHKK